jgi:hypothetical protein
MKHRDRLLLVLAWIAATAVLSGSTLAQNTSPFAPVAAQSACPETMPDVDRVADKGHGFAWAVVLIFLHRIMCHRNSLNAAWYQRAAALTDRVLKGARKSAAEVVDSLADIEGA